MKRKAGVMIAVILICLMCSMPVWARAGGGGGGSGSGGSSGSGGGGGPFSGSSSDASGSQSGNVVGVFVQGMFLLVLASGGSIVLIWKGRKAKRRSRQAMKVFAQMGDNWDAKEIQRQVEEAYFQIQECWRRMDISYGAPYLSEELQKEFDSKIQWMVIRNEEVIQKNVRLLRAMPVSVQDEPGEEQDVIWYLIHGKMTGYYVNRQSRKVVRGKTRPEAFFEYWKFVYRNKRWVLQEIRQQNEMDIDAMENTQSTVHKLDKKKEL